MTCLTLFALSAKVLTLNASATRDLDGLDTLPFNFDWTCKDGSGDLCVSQAGTRLDTASFAADELLTLPKETLPAGEEQQVFNFTLLRTIIWAYELNSIDALNNIGVLNQYYCHNRYY